MPARILEQINAFRVKTNYRKFLVKGVLTLPLDWHTEHHSGDTIDKVEKGATGLYNFSEDSYENIYFLVQFLVSYAMLIYFSKVIALVALPILLFSAWLTTRFDRILVPQYKELNRCDNVISESITDAFTNISTVVILRVEKYVFDAIAHRMEKPTELYSKNIKLNELKWFLTSLCCNVMYATSLFVYLWQHFGAGPGAISGSVYLLMRYLDEIAELFFKFAGSYSDVIKRRARVANSEELSLEFRQENFSNHVLPNKWKTLSVSNLSFSYYGDGGELQLDNVSFSVNHGERVALIGETGSGKTTFLKIMRDLYHPRYLKLSVDGKLIPSGFEGINRAITLVQQDPEIFAKTIMENITMGAEHELDFVLRFTDMACFTGVAQSLPNKFDSSIKEKGVNLSGGQQQRLALSRGLLACYDKDIILLDEPTSSLDALTEIAVYQNIFRGFEGKTVISTVHQLHLLPLFDRVCVFDKGKIVGTGTTTELLSSCPKFASLWNAQKSMK
jgi:ABC-type multidrug transport system fused ATPase/permease subunit